MSALLLALSLIGGGATLAEVTPAGPTLTDCIVAAPHVVVCSRDCTAVYEPILWIGDASEEPVSVLSASCTPAGRLVLEFAP